MNRTILEDREAKVLVLRQLRDRDVGESFGEVVARTGPESGSVSTSSLGARYSLLEFRPPWLPGDSLPRR